MKHFSPAIDELLTRTKTKKLNLEAGRAEFHRKAINHYSLIVLPQLEAFHGHIGNQGVATSIERLYPLDEYILRASFIIERQERVSVLELDYDFSTRTATFARTGGLARSSREDVRQYPDFDQLTSVEVYDVVADFVISVLEAGKP
jgi:hypothetical protein